ncbi:N-acetylglucosamine-6-phosphate deacetylase [Pleomorphochaeta sp. DL1XJH-081]|uniref:N-acetylglucosamine-6-phosphate deacetylase n=1 Tax=Pleomorphochaeta sp. DL1XJH-081 TaxID=3409690 RepID=UPI003BB58A7A
MSRTKTVKGLSIFSDESLVITYSPGGIESIERIPYEEGLPFISPGFLDMQVNGFHGADYSLEHLEPAHVKTLVDFLAKTGTTRHIPTFVTMPQERLLKNLRLVRKAIDNDKSLAAAIPGFHVEGPFISPVSGPRGVHDPKYIREPVYEDFLLWQEAAQGSILYVTVAPEVPGAIDFIKQVVRTGVKVAIGHSGADPEVILYAVEAGATISTHLGNGSFTEIPRLKNYIWEQLASDQLTAGIICDGYHLPPSVVKVFTRAKSLDRLVLVSDVALLGGYPPGEYKWGDMDVDVHEDGHLGLHGTSVLAGAAHTLDWDIAHFMAYTNHSLQEAVRLCTVNPAKLLGIDTSGYDAFTIGGPANLCTFHYEKGMDRLQIVSSPIT